MKTNQNLIRKMGSFNVIQRTHDSMFDSTSLLSEWNKESGLIIIFGASDDLVELRGSIYDEIDAYEGTHFIIATHRTEIPVDGDEDEETYKNATAFEVMHIAEESTIKNNRFEAVWSPENPDCSWLIKTDLPHSTFDIMEYGELYCRGIVIDASILF